MKDVTVTSFRQNLQAFLARVRRGEHLRVTSRGEVIAELFPPSVHPEQAERSRLKLRGSVVSYKDPLAPVFEENEWEMHR